MTLYTHKIKKLQIQLDSALGVERNHHIDKTCRSKEVIDFHSHLDETQIEPLNMKLRCLSLAQAVDFALAQTHQNNLQQSLTNQVNALLDKHLTEIEFNTEVLKIMHEANLTEGCASSKEAQALLGYYRNMAAILNPTPILETETSLLHNGKKIEIIETQTPLTQKTEEQQEALDKNYFHPEKEAFNLAHEIFKEKLKQNNTILPAQARKTHPLGLKNAFYVTVKIVIDALELSDTDDLIKEFSFIRMGSPVPETKGLSQEEITQFTKQNLHQLKECTQKITGEETIFPHVITLNTETFNRNQEGSLVQTLRTLSDEEQPEFSWKNIPVNFLGRMERLFQNPYPPVLEEIKTANETFKLAVLHCSSGQDRTGTVIEDYIQHQMNEQLKQEIPDLEERKELITRLREATFNTAEISTHLSPGSNGLKKESFYSGLFDPRIDHVLYHRYRRTANTNKNPIVGDCAFLQKPSDSAWLQFNTHLQNLEKENELAIAIQQLQIYHTLSSQDVALLNRIMSASSKQDSEQLLKCIPELQALQDHKKWKQVAGIVLSILSALMLVTMVATGVASGIGLPLLLAATIWITSMSTGLSMTYFNRNAFSQSKAVDEITTQVRACLSRIPGSE